MRHGVYCAILRNYCAILRNSLFCITARITDDNGLPGGCKDNFVIQYSSVLRLGFIPGVYLPPVIRDGPKRSAASKSSYAMGDAISNNKVVY